MSPATVIRIIRAPFLVASAIPFSVGVAYAWWRYGVFQPFPCLLSGVAVLLCHAGANVINDHHDHLSGCDRDNRSAIPPFTGGSGVIDAGIVSARGLRLIALSLFAAGLGLGLTFARLGLMVPVVMAAGLVTGYFYTTFFTRRGWGELIIVLNFGFFATGAGSYAAVPQLDGGLLLVSLLLGLAVLAILLINQFPDEDADRRAGKRTLAVRVGAQAARRWFATVLSTVYALLFIGLAARLFPAAGAGATLCLPLAWRACALLRRGPSCMRQAIKLTIAHQCLLGCVLVLAFALAGRAGLP